MHASFPPAFRNRRFLVVLALALLAACGPGNRNTAPTIDGPAQVSAEVGAFTEVDLTIADEDTPTVMLQATSSNQAVLPNDEIEITGHGTFRTLVLSPQEAGEAVVTLTATDSQGAKGTLELTVAARRPFGAEPTVLRPVNGDEVGTSAAISERFAVVGGDEFVYVYELVGEDWVERQKLVPPAGGGTTVAFGWSVDVAGEVIAIGAPGSDGGVGAAFVYELVDASWELQKRLPDTTFPAGAGFGRQVAVHGGAVYVSATGDTDGDDVRTGTVAVYTKDELTGWGLQEKLEPDYGGAAGALGWTLDVGADVVVAGDISRAGQAGSASVFTRVAGAWSGGVEVPSPVAEAGYQFGIGVATDAGYVLVGAWNDDDADENAGAVYVFYDGGIGWQEQAKLYPSDPMPHGSFGSSVALHYPYAVVGAQLADEGGLNATGAAYVLHHDGLLWHEVAKLGSPEVTEEAKFGFEVDIAGDHVIVTQGGDAPLAAIFRR